MDPKAVEICTAVEEEFPVIDNGTELDVINQRDANEKLLPECGEPRLQSTSQAFWNKLR
jgi:hypothetical protein